MDAVAAAKRLVVQTQELIAAVRFEREALYQQRALARRLSSEARYLRSVTAHDLMPLDMAIATVFRRAYERRAQARMDVRPTGHLDGLAYTVAEFMPIYVYVPDGRSLRKLAKEDLAGGLFQGGGKALIYLDGRAPITNLAVNAKSLPAVIDALNAARRALFAAFVQSPIP
jgi:hypothetical protein